MNKSVLIQKQVKDNADDLQKEFLDMKNWEEQMKRKEEELKQNASNEAIIPAVRSKVKSKAKKEKRKGDKCKKIKSCDENALDKYDVDDIVLKKEACKEIEIKEGACKKIETKEEACKEIKIKEEACEEMENSFFHTEKSADSKCETRTSRNSRSAIEYKNKGNELVQRKKWSKAVQYYSKAIELDPTVEAFYTNRALCFIKLEDYFPAEIDCTLALALNPACVKAYYRRAVAQFNMCKFKAAKKDAKAVLRMDPRNMEAKKMLEDVNDKAARETRVQHEIERLVSFERKWEHGLDMDLFYENAAAKSNEENRDINNRQSNSDATVGLKKKCSAQNPSASNDPRISPSLEGCYHIGLIQFVEKPPHLRSKKALTTIKVEGTELYCQPIIPELHYTIVDVNTQRCSMIKSSLKKETCMNNDLKQETSCATISTPSKDNSVLPPLPRNAVDFILTWNRHTSSEFRYRYLKQLPPNSLADIFLYSMESETLSQILEVVRVEFVKRKDDVYSILKDISELQRFRALSSFFSASDKKGLEELFSYCKTAKNISADEISSLREKYEL